MSNSQRSTFPISQAFLFALQGIRLRMGRMLLVLAGVAVAIAFTNVLLTSDAMFKKASETVTGAVAGEALKGIFRWLWMGVALLICTIGTLNAIVMSVTERIKEIGTLKCLGSRNIHIVEIFLFESVLLGVLGGIAGGLIGYGGALLNFVATMGAKHLTAEVALHATASVFGWEVNVLACIFVCAGLSAGLALLASVIPVLMAANVEPAAAMRYEV